MGKRRSIANLLCAPILFFAWQTDLWAQSTAGDSLTQQLTSIYSRHHFAGFSVAVVSPKGVVYENAFGYSDVARKIPYTAETLQNIGSISKTFIGIALLKAQEQKKLRLDDPISGYLPFEVRNPTHPHVAITIRQLATHTSSIIDTEQYLQKSYVLKPGQQLDKLKLEIDDEQRFNPVDSLVSMRQFLENMLSPTGKWHPETHFTAQRPGDRYEYSNIGATLAALVLERATGMPFDAFTQKYILGPLKMRSSGWHFQDIDFSRHSTLYYDAETPIPFYSLITYPDGNLITNLHDLGKYLQELLRAYDGKGKLLTKDSYRELFRQQLDASHYEKRNLKNPYNDSYNSGIFMGFSATGNIGHSGGDPGVSTMMIFDPEKKRGKILIINTNINDREGSKAFFEVLDALGTAY